MNILSIIPARGGSKGLPNKNIKPLCGKPLIAHTIEASRKCNKILRTVVSTDSPKIAGIAQEYGAEVPFLRPQELSGDDVPSINVVLHCLDFLKQQENYIPDFVCLLQCTSPLRTDKHINEAVNLITYHDAESVISVCKADKSPFWAKLINHKGFLEDFVKSDQEITRRQGLPDTYNLNGAIYINKTSLIIETQKMVNDKSYPYIMGKLHSADIDDAVDFEFCEFLMRKLQVEGRYENESV